MKTVDKTLFFYLFHTRITYSCVYIHIFIYLQTYQVRNETYIYIKIYSFFVFFFVYK